MPVIRVDTTTTTTTPPPEVRTPLLAKLKGEFDHNTEQGPAIFEIPLGTGCIDVLVVWEEWADWLPEERARLILDAYKEDEREKIAQVLGKTYDEAMQEQLLPYTIVSTFEQTPKAASLVCDDDENAVRKLMATIRDIKLANGGMFLPNGKIALRFPTRKMVDSALEKVQTANEELEPYWFVVVEAALSA